MIKVMQHYENGGKVEYSEKKGGNHWTTVTSPSWDWAYFEYRIKEPKQKVTIEKWLIEEYDIKFVVETSDIYTWLKSFPKAKKLKLIEAYEVEL